MTFQASRWAGLSEQQLAVVQWVVEGKGSLQLLARAGCGKSFTLKRAVEAIIEHRLGDVAMMAFNKSIAGELKSWLEEQKYNWKVAQAGTVHSFGFSAWRNIAPHVKVDDKKLRNIINGEAQRPGGEIFLTCDSAINKLCSMAKQRAFGHLEPIESIEAWLDIWEHFNIEDEVTEDVSVYDVIRAAQIVYRISLKQCREIIDFDDMILAPLVFKARFWPKDWILLDESQDTNPARRALALAMLKPRTGRMIFVGDPMQAIYGFAGADSNSMDQLRAATNATTLPLNVTRRCPKLVVREAQRLVPDIQAFSENGDGVVRSILYEDLSDEDLSKNDAILCRNTAPLITTAYTMLSRGVPCKVEGREIGSGLVKLAKRWKLKTLDKLLLKLDDYEARQTARFMSLGQDARVQAVVDQVECLRVIISRCLSQDRHSIHDLVEDIDNMFGNTPDGKNPEVLTLSTIHRSKGREWERVFILGRDRYMPSPYAKQDWAVQQEKNLEYVAITRSLKELIDVAAPALSTKEKQ